jgi:hypothetical protein
MMRLSTAAQARSKRMEKMARDAITQYNKDVAAGGEPLFPDWALDLLALLDSYDRLVRALTSTNMHPVNAIDFETGVVRDSIVRVDRAAS